LPDPVWLALLGESLADNLTVPKKSSQRTLSSRERIAFVAAGNVVTVLGSGIVRNGNS
jgi:hypothetical protein